MVLILDDKSTRVISNALGMYDLMEHRVTIVEDISKSRAPYRDMAAVYLLAPTMDSVNKLIQDWTPTTARKEPLYSDSVFLFFLGEVEDVLLARIKSCKPLVRRIKTLSEVNLDFLVKEERAFHLDMHSCFSQLFSSAVQPSPLEEIIADKLVTVCATLNEFPHIRYVGKSRVCKSLAALFDEKFMQFIGMNESFWYYGDPEHNTRGRATLLLLDRTDDCLSPLVHEFTYQAMVHDLLTVDDDRFTYKADAMESGGKKPVGDNEQTVLLNENDKIWVEMRRKHIADVIQTLSTRIKEIVNSSTGAALNTKGQNSKTLSLAQMTDALKALPEYREIMSKLSQHMHISHQCMDIFGRNNLNEISDLEQTLGTGKTDENRSPKVSELVSLVEEAMQGIRDPYDRFRLLAIFIISQRGLRQIDQARLFGAAKLNQETERALSNLTKIGIPMIQTAPKTSKKIGGLMGSGGQRLVSRAVAESDSEYSSSRFACDLKDVLEKAQNGSLRIEEYPSVRPLPEQGASTGTATSARGRGKVSARKQATSKWSKSNKKKDTNASDTFNGARLITFMVGGLCYSELRAANDLMSKGGREIIVGSTTFLTPQHFIKELASL